MHISSVSLIAQLRSATSELHRQLDQALGLMEQSVTREKYVAFLLGSLTALEPLEPQLRAFGGSEEPSRCDRLREDLSSLGNDATISPLGEVPVIRSEAAAFGARYVIEGSALGGAVLARAFDGQLQLNGESQRYLTLHGARLGEHWRAFCAELEQFGSKATPDMQSEACVSARAVFMLYASAFRRTGAIAANS